MSKLKSNGQTLASVYMLEYMQGDDELTIEKVAEKFHKSASYMMALSARDGWVEAREKYRRNHGLVPENGKLAKKSRDRSRDWEYLSKRLMMRARKILDDPEKEDEVVLDSMSKLIASLEKCYNNIRKEDGVDAKVPKQPAGTTNFNQFNQFQSAYKLTTQNENTRPVPVEGDPVQSS